MSETEEKSLLRLVMTPSGCSPYCIRSGVGRLSYKAHISAVNVPLPISFLFHEYLDVAGSVFRLRNIFTPSTLTREAFWLVNISDRQQIDAELSGLIALQTAFYQKGNPTPAEIQAFEQAGRRIRELFAELAQMKAA
jgi:hypothetical protein